MANIIAKPPGQPVPKLDKRSIENILYSIDLSEILEQGELASGAQNASTNNLVLEEINTRMGKFIDVRIPPSNVSTSQYIDYTVSILFNTSLNNTRAAVFQLRVHK